MIKEFKCKKTGLLWQTGKSKYLPSTILRSALRKLVMLDSAYVLEDLRSPPNNRLEALKGDRFNQCSIRINDQWRICFVWCDQHAYQVEIIDYH